jgi:hypothetical protein
MFDLKENAGDNHGYELRIGYNRARAMFYVRGYIVFRQDRYEVTEYERDGSTLWFPSQEDAMEHILKYPVPNPNQMKFNFEIEETTNGEHE